MPGLQHSATLSFCLNKASLVAGKALNQQPAVSKSSPLVFALQKGYPLQESYYRLRVGVGKSLLERSSTPKGSFIETTKGTRCLAMAGASPAATAATMQAVIIWLHGLGDSGAGWSAIESEMANAPELKKAKWIFSDAPSKPVSCNDGYIMPSWFDLPEIPLRPTSPNVENEVMEAARKIHQMIDKEVASGVPANRVIIGGFSQGGALTLASALTYKEQLGGAVVFSGWVPFDNFAEKISERGKLTPVLWCHGESDTTVFHSCSKQGVPLLQSLGVKCEHKSYPGMAHSACPEEMAHLKAWLRARLS